MNTPKQGEKVSISVGVGAKVWFFLDLGTKVSIDWNTAVCPGFVLEK